MKKKTIAAAALLLPLTLTLCACGGTPQLELGANWYRFCTEAPGGFSEELEYKVSFKPDDSNTFLSYDNGTYTAALAPTLADSGEQVYYLHTELNISGTYSVNDERMSFTDKVESDVYFKLLSSQLQPVKSVKYVKSTSPLTATPSSLSAAYTEFEYTCTVNYNDAAEEAAVTYSQTLPEAREIAETVSIGSGVSFFDNEQILFVLRGLNMSSAVSLRTINPLDFTVTTVSMTGTPSQTPLVDFSFVLNGETVAASAEKPVNAYTATIAYAKGQSQTLVYAANTTASAGENLYRNVLLRMSVPILQSLGTLNYELVKANFSAS